MRHQAGFKHYDTSAQHILASVENSLRALRTDRLDVLLIHRPDPLLDPDDVAEAFMQLQRSGKVLFFGVSNFTPSQFDALQSRLETPLVTQQIELSVMRPEPLHDGTVDQCLKLGIAPMAWSPLAGGALFHSEAPRAVRLREALNSVGEQLGGASVDQVALAWLLRHPARIVPILGTHSVARIHSAAAALSLVLDRQQWFTIWSASMGHEVP
jgi:predicted oxidoreductase